MLRLDNLDSSPTRRADPDETDHHQGDERAVEKARPPSCDKAAAIGDGACVSRAVEHPNDNQIAIASEASRAR